MSKGGKRKTAAAPAGKPGDEGGGFWRVLGRGLWAILALGATVVLLIGLPVRLALRDSVQTFAVVYYATPWVVLAVCGYLAAWYWRAWRKVALGILLLALCCTGAWIGTAFRFGAAPGGVAAFRVAYWNCARPGWRLGGILPKVESWRADLVCFGESRPTGPLSTRWAETFPNYRIQPLAREMLVLGPEATERKSSGSLGNAGEFHLLRSILGGREVFILLVDFDGLATQSREPAFARLYQLVDAYATQPLIVMGDFNTPSDSVHFRRLRAWMTDAFEAAGSGCNATWPMVAPVISIDHILVNKHLRVVRAEHQGSLYSDHRAVIADVAWP